MTPRVTGYKPIALACSVSSTRAICSITCSMSVFMLLSPFAS